MDAFVGIRKDTVIVIFNRYYGTSHDVCKIFTRIIMIRVHCCVSFNE